MSESTTTKPVITSKTLWFNTLATAIVPILKWQGVEVPPDVLTSIVTLGNIILRLVTSKSLQS